MSNVIPFTCPSCGKPLKTVVKPDTYDNFVSIPCINCGGMFTKENLKSQLREFAIEAAKEAFARGRR